MNSQNLIPNSERSPEELREMGRKGGIKSGESRRKNRELRKVMQWVMSLNQEEVDKLFQMALHRMDKPKGNQENHRN